MPEGATCRCPSPSAGCARTLTDMQEPRASIVSRETVFKGWYTFYRLLVALPDGTVVDRELLHRVVAGGHLSDPIYGRAVAWRWRSARRGRR